MPGICGAARPGSGRVDHSASIAGIKRRGTPTIHRFWVLAAIDDDIIKRERAGVSAVVVRCGDQRRIGDLAVLAFERGAKGAPATTCRLGVVPVHRTDSIRPMTDKGIRHFVADIDRSVIDDNRAFVERLRRRRFEFG